MRSVLRRSVVIGLAGLFALAVSALAADKKFADSEDAHQKDEPQKFLPDYDKLVKGKDADWVYFPDGSALSKYKTVSVEEFDHTGHGTESREAARDGKDYMEQWLEKEGFKVVKSGGDLQIEGNVFNAWEPSGGLGAERRGPLLGWLGGQPGRRPGADLQGRRQGRRGAPPQGQGLDGPRCGRERAGGHGQVRREGALTQAKSLVSRRLVCGRGAA
jgi:hypothetical protein